MDKPILTDTDIVNIGSDTDIISVSVQPYYFIPSAEFLLTYGGILLGLLLALRSAL